MLRKVPYVGYSRPANALRGTVFSDGLFVYVAGNGGWRRKRPFERMVRGEWWEKVMRMEEAFFGSKEGRKERRRKTPILTANGSVLIAAIHGALVLKQSILHTVRGCVELIHLKFVHGICEWKPRRTIWTSFVDYR